MSTELPIQMFQSKLDSTSIRFGPSSNIIIYPDVRIGAIGDKSGTVVIIYGCIGPWDSILPSRVRQSWIKHGQCFLLQKQKWQCVKYSFKAEHYLPPPIVSFMYFSITSCLSLPCARTLPVPESKTYATLLIAVILSPLRTASVSAEKIIY